MNKENQIINIDGYVHVVNGKVICFKPDVYDLNNPDDVKDLLGFVADLSNSDSELSVLFDDCNFVGLELSNELGFDGSRVIDLHIGWIDCLSDNVKEHVKSVMGG